MTWGSLHGWEGRTEVSDEMERLLGDYRWEERARWLSWFAAGFVVSSALWITVIVVVLP